MRKQIHLQQRSPEWLEWRKNKIGASDIAAILGESPFNTRLQLWEKKFSNLNDSASSAMERGVLYEEEARLAAAQSLGSSYEPACFESVEYPFLIASLDGWNEAQGALEIKVPREDDHLLALGNFVPQHYMAQCQQIMLVTNTKDMFYASYSPAAKSLATVLVKRNDDYCERIIKASESFVRSLEDLEPPEPSERDYIQFDDVSGKGQEYKEKYEAMKTLERELEGLKSEIIQEVGGHNAYLGDLRVSKIVKKGNIDYKSIPELLSINLNKFRKPPVVSYRLS